MNHNHWPQYKRFQYKKKIRATKKVSIIQEPFFKHGVMNNFGKFSIIAEPFTNQHPTLSYNPLKAS